MLTYNTDKFTEYMSGYTDEMQLAVLFLFML